MKKNGHAIIPSSALVPENDPTTLFTGSGMQPLIPYLMGEKHPMGTRLADSQKCFRSGDIEEVGDNRHTTFFEMLGNWSLGDYFKQEQLRFFFTYMVDEIGLDPNKIYVTVFAGDESLGIPRDDESVAIWKELFAERGIEALDVFIGSEEDGYEVGMQSGRIFYYDAAKNWWSRSGKPANMPAGEIGGSCSEVFYDFGAEHATHPIFGKQAAHPNSDSGQFLEIGNSVFIEYIKNPDGTFTKLPQSNVDFGGGLERLAAAHNGDPDVFKVDLLKTVVTQIEELSGTKYDDNLVAYRVITDHIRGAVFLISDGVMPGNSDQSYFVRRLLRRAVRFADQINIPAGKFAQLAQSVISTYGTHYPNLIEKSKITVEAIKVEEKQFRRTLQNGLAVFERFSEMSNFYDARDNLARDNALANMSRMLLPNQIYELITTYGFPRELIIEEAQNKEIQISQLTWTSVDELLNEHRNLSRAGAEQKFKGGLADGSDQVVQYHTATHLMLAALREILGTHVHQAGSNITNERLRYDITHPEKVETAMIARVEAWVNNAIRGGGEVSITMMSKTDALNDPTIEASFWDRYPDEVKVYTMTNQNGTVLSRELCGGPHVTNLSEIKGTFKITKEESSAAGIRRIKATLG